MSTIGNISFLVPSPVIDLDLFFFKATFLLVSPVVCRCRTTTRESAHISHHGHSTRSKQAVGRGITRILSYLQPFDSRAADLYMPYRDMSYEEELKVRHALFSSLLIDDELLSS